jgi:hypothetical protein
MAKAESRRSWNAFGRARTSAVVALAAICAGPPRAQAQDAAPAPTEIRREIRVRIACDEEFRAHEGWERTARERLAKASGVFERRFGIRWSPVDVVAWTSDDSAAALHVLVDQLADDVRHEDVDLVLGFSGQTRARGADRDYGLAGSACYLGPAAVVRDVNPARSSDWYAGKLIHELGHVLGAWHCVDARFMMYAGGEGRPNADFDPQSAAVIELMRDLDFKRGGDWIDDARRRKLEELFRAGHAAGELLPYVRFDLGRALRCERRNLVTASRDLYRRALAEQEACVGAADPTLVRCLVHLARADLREPGKNVDEAERLARRANDLTAASGVAEDPPLDSDFVLAGVALERGRRDEAVAGYLKVYDARLTTRGASDPGTIDVKSVLDDAGVAPPAAAARKPWTDVAWAAPSPLPGDPAVGFESPRPGTIHLRESTAPATAKSLDSGARTFDVVAGQAGTLTLELREVGASGDVAAPSPCRVSAHVAAAGAGTVVAFSYRTTDAAPTNGQLRYAVRMSVATPETDPSPAAKECACTAPCDVAICVNRVLKADASGFLRFAAGPTLLFERLWVGTPGERVLALDADAAAFGVIGGKRFTPDGVGAKRAWRLELTFAPDGAK